MLSLSLQRGAPKRNTAVYGSKSHIDWRNSAKKFLCVKTVSDKVVGYSLAELSVWKWLVEDVPLNVNCALSKPLGPYLSQLPWFYELRALVHSTTYYARHLGSQSLIYKKVTVTKIKAKLWTEAQYSSTHLVPCSPAGQSRTSIVSSDLPRRSRQGHVCPRRSVTWRCTHRPSLLPEWNSVRAFYLFCNKHMHVIHQSQICLAGQFLDMQH